MRDVRFHDRVAQQVEPERQAGAEHRNAIGARIVACRWICAADALVVAWQVTGMLFADRVNSKSGACCCVYATPPSKNGETSVGRKGKFRRPKPSVPNSGMRNSALTIAALLPNSRWNVGQPTVAAALPGRCRSLDTRLARTSCSHSRESSFRRRGRSAMSCSDLQRRLPYRPIDNRGRPREGRMKMYRR